MKITLHGGAGTIGGNCVEIASGASRIIVDLGIPLTSLDGSGVDTKELKESSLQDLIAAGVLPDIKGLYRTDTPSVNAILISHSHLDHYGFLKHLHPSIPVYMSKGARIFVKVSEIFNIAKTGAINVVPIIPRKKVKIGDFEIVPHLVDHSAFDALAFTIGAAGKKIFYSGDLRGHGRKSHLFKNMLKSPPSDIDCLILEGTMLSGRSSEQNDERSVENSIRETLAASNDITFIFAASQNIDRIVSMYKACRKVGKILVIDTYTAFILSLLRSICDTIPQPDWHNVRVKFNGRQAEAISDAGYRELLHFLGKRKMNDFDIERKRREILLFLHSHAGLSDTVKSLGDARGTTAIWSMWEGYLDEKLAGYCAKKGITIKKAHAGGHAPLEDLRDLAATMKPAMIIPIHTTAPEKFKEAFSPIPVNVLRAGESLKI